LLPFLENHTAHSPAGQEIVDFSVMRLAGRRILIRAGLEKIEALVVSLGEARKEQRTYAANIGGASRTAPGKCQSP